MLHHLVVVAGHIAILASPGVAAKLGVVIAGGEWMRRSPLRTIFDGEPDIQVVGEASNGREVADRVACLKPNVLLIDAGIPGGIEATREVCDSGRNRHTNVLVVTALARDSCVYECLGLGARGILTKDAQPREVLDGVRAVGRGDVFLSSAVAARLIDHVIGDLEPHPSSGKVAELSTRELEVLRLMAQPLSNSEIAATLDLSIHTVKTHVSHMLEKLELRNRTELVVAAYRSGVVRAS